MGRGKRLTDSKVPMGPALMLLKGIHFYNQHFLPAPGTRGCKEKWESLRIYSASHLAIFHYRRYHEE